MYLLIFITTDNEFAYFHYIFILRMSPLSFMVMKCAVPLAWMDNPHSTPLSWFKIYGDYFAQPLVLWLWYTLQREHWKTWQQLCLRSLCLSLLLIFYFPALPVMYLLFNAAAKAGTNSLHNTIPVQPLPPSPLWLFFPTLYSDVRILLKSKYVSMRQVVMIEAR